MGGGHTRQVHWLPEKPAAEQVHWLPEKFPAEQVHWLPKKSAAEQKQIPSNAWGRARGALQGQDEDSRAIDSQFARTPGRTPCGNTTARDPVPDLHRRGPSQMILDADTNQAHQHR